MKTPIARQEMSAELPRALWAKGTRWHFWSFQREGWRAATPPQWRCLFLPRLLRKVSLISGFWWPAVIAEQVDCSHLALPPSLSHSPSSLFFFFFSFFVEYQVSCSLFLFSVSVTKMEERKMELKRKEPTVTAGLDSGPTTARRCLRQALCLSMFDG